MFRQKSIFNLATCLTISRFFLVPVFIYYFLADDFTWAVITLIIASITDVTDGLLARRFNMSTNLGSVLDPLADKFLMMISFIVLSAKDVFPPWLALIVIGRDFYIVFGLMYIYYVRRVQVVIKPSRLSKSTTFAQFVLLVMSFIKVYIVKREIGLTSNYQQLFLNVQHAMVYVAAMLTIVTFVQYTQMGLKMLRENQRRSS